MKLREKIDLIDSQIAMLEQYMWFVQKKLNFDHADVMAAAHELKKIEEINKLRRKATELGLRLEG